MQSTATSVNTLANELKELVKDPTRQGQRLPSLRTLSRQFQVSHETVRRAMQALEEQGLVNRIHGYGTVVTHSPNRERTGNSPEQASIVPTAPARNKLLLATAEYQTGKQAVWDRLLSGFGAQHEHVAIRPTSLEYEGLDLSLELPDILHLPSWQMQALAKRGMLLNIAPWLNANVYENDCMIEGLADGPIYGLPIAFDLSVMYINTSRITAPMLRQLDRDWSLPALINWAAAFRAGAGAGRPLWLPRPHVLMSFLGIDALSVTALQSNTQQLTAILPALADLNALYPFYEENVSDPYLAAEAAFIAGDALITCGHTFGLVNARSKCTFNWAVRPIPAPPQFSQQRVDLCCAVSKNCFASEVAASFVAYLASPEGQSIIGTEKANVPVRRSAAQTAFASEAPAGLDRVIAGIGPTTDTGIRFVRAFTASYANVWDEEINRFLHGESTTATTIDRIRQRCVRLTTAHGIDNEGHEQ